MRKVITIFAVVAIVYIGSVTTQATISLGTWSTDSSSPYYDPDLKTGTPYAWTEHYAGGGPKQMGNWIVAMSSGTGPPHIRQWYLNDIPAQTDFLTLTDTDIQVEDNRVDGTGTVVYTIDYTGGKLTLNNATGLWGDGSTFENLIAVVTATYEYTNGVCGVGDFSSVVDATGTDALGNVISFTAETVRTREHLSTGPGDIGYQQGDVTNVELTIVPEPATVCLLGLGGLLLRRRKHVA